MWIIYLSTVSTIKSMELIFPNIVCNWSPVGAIWTNYEDVGFQPRPGTATSLDSVACCCVPFFRVIYFSIRLPSLGLLSCSPQLLFLCLNLTPSSHLHRVLRPPGISMYRPSIYNLHIGASAYLGVARLHTSISESPHACSRCFPLAPTVFSSRPVVSSCLPTIFTPRLHYAVSLAHLVAPCVPHAPSLFVACLPYAYLKYQPQRHPMFHCFLSSSNVGHIWLGYHRFLH